MSFLYENDLLNRYASHTLTKTTDNDVIQWEFKDGSDNIVSRRKGSVGTDEVILKNIRTNLKIDPSVPPCLTTTERNALTGTIEGQQILNITGDELEYYDGSSWKGTSGG